MTMPNYLPGRVHHFWCWHFDRWGSGSEEIFLDLLSLDRLLFDLVDDCLLFLRWERGTELLQELLLLVQNCDFLQVVRILDIRHLAINLSHEPLAACWSWLQPTIAQRSGIFPPSFVFFTFQSWFESLNLSGSLSPELELRIGCFEQFRRPRKLLISPKVGSLLLSRCCASAIPWAASEFFGIRLLQVVLEESIVWSLLNRCFVQGYVLHFDRIELLLQGFGSAYDWTISFLDWVFDLFACLNDLNLDTLAYGSFRQRLRAINRFLNFLPHTCWWKLSL